MAATSTGAGSIRARVRAEMTDEIKTIARRHLAADGANLSLRAVARDMGMVSSALYRYFASRDDLLTELIIDGYDAMGEVAEAADAAVKDRADLAGRWIAVAVALRHWAVAHPAEYALLYGSPVPGYVAPQATVGPATRPVLVLGAILADAHASGLLASETSPPAPPLPRALRPEVRRAAGAVAAGLPEQAMARGLIAWTELFGAISFDVFDRLKNTIDERSAWFEYQTRCMVEYLGLTDAAPRGGQPAHRGTRTPRGASRPRG
ncbi:MAG: WHG domain-containing protein [Micromonosporaceae bacterium]|nr:WHG domain-containing protein [Micromonosporaceae bacterium]